MYKFYFLKNLLTVIMSLYYHKVQTLSNSKKIIADKKKSGHNTPHDSI